METFRAMPDESAELFFQLERYLIRNNGYNMRAFALCAEALFKFESSGFIIDAQIIVFENID